MATIILRLNEGDATVDLYEPRLVLGTSGTVITVSGGLGTIGSLNNGDSLFILAHGTPADVGGYSASALAKLLVDAGLKSNVTIVLVACDTGRTGAPFALELKTQLVSLKVLPASVSGGTNTMYVTPTGVPTTFWSKADGNWGHTVAASATVNTPWGPRKVNSTPTFKTS